MLSQRAQPRADSQDISRYIIRNLEHLWDYRHLCQCIQRGVQSDRAHWISWAKSPANVQINPALLEGCSPKNQYRTEYRQTRLSILRWMGTKGIWGQTKLSKRAKLHQISIFCSTNYRNAFIKPQRRNTPNSFLYASLQPQNQLCFHSKQQANFGNFFMSLRGWRLGTRFHNFLRNFIVQWAQLHLGSISD